MEMREIHHLSEVSCDRDWELDDSGWSANAWMSTLDLKIIETALSRLVENRARALRCFEWGSGRSTLHFSKLLDGLASPTTWISAEYDRGWFEEFWSNSKPTSCCKIYHMEHPFTSNKPDPGINFLLYDYGRLLPMKREFSHHRYVEMKDYVNSIGLFSTEFDFIFVDGRKRNQCLFAASQKIKRDGLVFLHDAWRPYYALGATFFQTTIRVGDSLMVGSHMPLVDLLEFINIEHFGAANQTRWIL